MNEIPDEFIDALVKGTTEILTVGLQKVAAPIQDAARAKRALRAHLEMVAAWAHEVSFKDLLIAKNIQDSFVDLDLNIGHFATRRDGRPKGDLKVSQLLSTTGNITLLGDPGAGKTTSLKKLASLLLAQAKTRKAAVPLLVRLRRIPADGDLLIALLELVGLPSQIATGRDGRPTPAEFARVADLLERLRAVVLLDGLDEVRRDRRDYFVDEIRELALRTREARIILTCRTADFRYSLERTSTHVLEPLSDVQIAEFATRWLGARAAPGFVAAVRRTPYAGVEVLPLTLAHLCAIFERTGEIPEKPRTVYRKVVGLLLEGWDEQRSVHRLSAYPQFSADRREEFLREFAFRLWRLGSRESYGPLDIERAFRLVAPRFGLPAASGVKIVREIESDTGLIVQTSDGAWEFYHKSIREYLCAEYLLRLPELPAANILHFIPDELALTVALSSDPLNYLVKIATALVRGHVSRGPTKTRAFLRIFLSRLVLESADYYVAPELGKVALEYYRLYELPHILSSENAALHDETAMRAFLAQSAIQDSVRNLYLEGAQKTASGWVLVTAEREQGKVEKTRLDERFLRWAGC